MEDGHFTTPIGKAKVLRKGCDITLAATSYMALESLRAAEKLAEEGVSAEVVDLRSIRPWDRDLVLESVSRTGRLVFADTGWSAFGIAAEIVSSVVEELFGSLKSAPARVALPDCPSPTSPALAAAFYPRWGDIVQAARRSLGRQTAQAPDDVAPDVPLDVPDSSFTGPF